LSILGAYIKAKMVACNSDYSESCSIDVHQTNRCYNGGLCCQPLPNHPDQKIHCVCSPMWDGQKCEELKLDFLQALSSMQESNISMFSLAAIISLIIAVVALLVLGGIVFLFARKSRQRKVWREKQQRNMETLSLHISQVQEEIEKLPTAEKLSHLTRLTKLVEVSCLTGGAVILKNAYTPPSSLSHSYLPRWSSAPMKLDTSHDVTDGDLISDEDKKQRQQLFSLRTPAKASNSKNTIV